MLRQNLGMVRLGLFRDRRTAVSAVMTGALVVALEVADGLASTDPEDEVRDQGTIEVFGTMTAAAIVGSCISLARHRPLPHRRTAWWTGLGLIWAGAAVNRAARRQLGRNYRSRVTVVPDHELVTESLYRWVRHPMYSGAALICTGAAVVIAAPASVLWALPALALVHRIQIEETMLRDALGTDYADFIDGRARLIPMVW
jgi:protein-S-isoprenylcysteine O-methyltransferase Ste14